MREVIRRSTRLGARNLYAESTEGLLSMIVQAGGYLALTGAVVWLMFAYLR